ncbi:hypothetical protein DICPUDRAFT_76504 [Dictyostelium purpureum]|uniref:Asl1-like glycosyl hydrolase catalytic domain-containing protein n=1 Tax=Dictyostelium purpureum TaxID=5786 RepID=F0ZDT6_DICPU|nr:uncharacterized protein DICPUDRAFT_76504 [Dictyostelium purpureum]EGC37921.1 hypothetical protein DICPUDRAFT_76504 [Dictyostelium purpureum]|eukprot:XP_003285581.1 hypothetical protein DICPUDRAFT_76504 [Dictyostelium purpureum]
MLLTNKNNLILFITLVLTISGFVQASKKGTTFGSDTFGDLAICNDIKDLNVSWYYNWDLKPNCVQNANLISNVKFYPTIWGKNNLNDTANIAKADVLFTFNEPNFKTQANLSPTDAAAKWPDIQKLGFKSIVGPSVADCPDNSDPNGANCNYGSVKWYTDFLNSCKGCQVDYANIHIYYCDADDVMNKITNLNKATGKKVWLTEFNCEGGKTDQDILKYAQKLLPLLEASDIVAGYSWFLPFYTQGNINSLYLNQNGKGDLSSIGKYYASVYGPSTNSSDTSSSQSASGSSGSSSSVDSAATKSNVSIFLLSLILLSLLL